MCSTVINSRSRPRKAARSLPNASQSSWPRNHQPHALAFPLRGQRVLEGAGRQPASFASAAPRSFHSLDRRAAFHASGHLARQARGIPRRTPALNNLRRSAHCSRGGSSSQQRVAVVKASRLRHCPPGVPRQPSFFNALEQRAARPSSTASGAVSVQHDRAVKTGMASMGTFAGHGPLFSSRSEPSD